MEMMVCFFKLKPNFSCGCWWFLKIIVNVLELSRDLAKSLVRQPTSSLSLATLVDSLGLIEFLACSTFSSRVLISYSKMSFYFFSDWVLLLHLQHIFFHLTTTKRGRASTTSSTTWSSTSEPQLCQCQHAYSHQGKQLQLPGLCHPA